MKKLVKQAFGIYTEKALPGEECLNTSDCFCEKGENCPADKCLAGIC